MSPTRWIITDLRGTQLVGAAAITFGFAVALAAMFYIAVNFPGYVWLAPLAIAGGWLMWLVLQHEQVAYFTAIGAFVLIADYSPETEVTEVLYSVYYLSFLGFWYAKRFLASPGTLIRHKVEIGLVIYFVWATLSLLWALPSGGKLPWMLGDWASVSMLAFYFPTRDIVMREHGSSTLLRILLFLGIAVALRNLFSFREIMVRAVYAWQVGRGRVVTNEATLMIPAFAALVTALYASTSWRRVLSVIIFAPCFIGLILTQSRGYWVDFAFGFAFLPLLLDNLRRRRLFWLCVIGSTCVAGLAILFFGDALYLMTYGWAERLLSLQSATEKDISLINRFYEARSVVELIKSNPLVGYGLGVPYATFDVIEHRTIVKHFVHNGYVGIFYKVGLIGACAMFFAWGGLIWKAFRLRRFKGLQPSSTFLFIGLISFIPSASTAIHFYVTDINFLFALMAGWIVGLEERARYCGRISPDAFSR